MMRRCALRNAPGQRQNEPSCGVRERGHRKSACLVRRSDAMLRGDGQTADASVESREGATMPRHSSVPAVLDHRRFPLLLGAQDRSRRS